MKVKHIFLFLFVLSLIQIATAQVGFPHQYYGSVTYNGAPANNLPVTAKIDNVLVASTTASNGHYSLKISNVNNDKDGKTISFFVNDIETGIKIVFQGDGELTELNLSASSSSSSNTGSTGSGGGGSGGDSGGGGSPVTLNNQNNSQPQNNLPSNNQESEGNLDVQEEQQETPQEEPKQNFFQRLLNSITGAFIGPQKTGTGIAVAFIIIILTLFVVFTVRKIIKKNQ